MTEEKLRRELGLREASAIVVGTIIGTGIFIVPNTIARQVEAPGLVFAVWILAGGLSLLGALTYAELGAAFSRVGGEYIYLRLAYGPLWGFLYGWTQFLVIKTGSIAALAAGFAIYLGHFLPLSERAGKAVAIASILLLSLVNSRGVRVGGLLQTGLTLLKVAIILGIVGLAFIRAEGTAAHYRPILPEGEREGWFGRFGLAMVAALWAYDGWNNVTMVAGEVAHPARTIPRALVAGTLVVILVYLLANLAYFYVLPTEAIRASERVAADVVEHVLGPPGAAIVSLAILISILGALNGSILSGARIFYAMAADGLFFKKVALVHERFRVPHVAIWAQAVWASLLAASGTYEQLFTYVIFAAWIFYGLTAVGCLVLRRRCSEIERPFRAPGYPFSPLLFGGLALLLTVSAFVGAPRESAIGLGIMLSGLPAYTLWTRKLKGEAMSEPDLTPPASSG
jgi:APA family basic amino acid/polyamine antiporter